MPGKCVNCRRPGKFIGGGIGNDHWYCSNRCCADHQTGIHEMFGGNREAAKQRVLDSLSRYPDNADVKYP